MPAHQLLDAVVVGAGFAGLYATYKLRELGLRFRAFERGSGVGGTWYWNRYPGASSDSESWVYSFTFSEELEQDIRSSGFFRNKAKNIRGAAEKIINDFGGQVPGTMEELLTLPGAGRKTANCILGNAFGIGGITCDTHVIRLSRRLGLSEKRDPVKLEFDLMDVVPKRKYGGWTMFSHYIIFHGRNICKARKPDCENCPIAKHCPSANKPDLW